MSIDDLNQKVSNETPTGSDPLGLASMIDAQNKADNFQEQLNAINADLALPLLSEVPVRIAARRREEALMRVAAGEVFHGKVESFELRKASNGSPFLSFQCKLEANGWGMGCTKFLDRRKIGSTEEIAMATKEELRRIGYDEENKTFPDVSLFLIGSWTSDSDQKTHLKIDRIFRDEADYNGYIRWKASRELNRKRYQAPDVPLPEL